MVNPWDIWYGTSNDNHIAVAWLICGFWKYQWLTSMPYEDFWMYSASFAEVAWCSCNFTHQLLVNHLQFKHIESSFVSYDIHFPRALEQLA